MAGIFSDKAGFRDGIKHFLLADVLWAAVLGILSQITFIALFGDRALLLLHGVLGLISEGLITWFAVYLSYRYLGPIAKGRVRTITVVSASLSVVTMLITAPFFNFFAGIIDTSVEFIVYKDIIHLIAFVAATVWYFKGYSLHAVLQESLR